MRILLVNKFHYLKGGSEKYYFELGQLLKEHGHEVAYFSMEDEKNRKTGCKEYFVKPIDLSSGSKRKALDVIYSKANYKKMIEAIEDFKPDVVHINNFQRQLSASIVDAIKEKKIPIVFTAHDLQAICPASAMLYQGEICQDCIEKGYHACVNKKCIKNSRLKSLLAVLEKYYYDIHKIYQKVDVIISPSEFVKNQLVKGKLKYKKIEVLHNFVLESHKSEINQDEGYAFFFGRLSIEKGILNVIQAIKNIENGRLLIAGSGPEQAKIETYIQENHLNDRIQLLGYLKQDEIRQYINKAKFVVVPSIWYENCPYSILETMEIGKPIIGSRIGGIPELIEDGVNGFLYSFNNIEELTAKIRKLFENSDLVTKQSENSRELFVKNYSAEIYYDKIMSLYNELIGEKEYV